jgi:hypothetical protein
MFAAFVNLVPIAQETPGTGQTMQWWLAFKLPGAMTQDWQIQLFPS